MLVHPQFLNDLVQSSLAVLVAYIFILNLVSFIHTRVPALLYLGLAKIEGDFACRVFHVPMM